MKVLWIGVLLGPIIPVLAWVAVYFLNKTVQPGVLKKAFKSLAWGLALAVCLNIIIWFVALVLPDFIDNHCSGDACVYFFLGLILAGHILSLIVSLVLFSYLLLTQK